jgi:hypothetical protein
MPWRFFVHWECLDAIAEKHPTTKTGLSSCFDPLNKLLEGVKTQCETHRGL